MREEDDVIATYRRELCAEADLARADLAEIEDHLRTLAAELRDSGMPAGEAIAEAARRLGDPRQVAREHARVRTVFGARLSRVRAWSATVLLVPVIAVVWMNAGHTSLTSPFVLNAVLATVMLASFAARSTFARPIVMAGAAHNLVSGLAFVPMFAPTTGTVLQMMCLAGALVFMVPWRRGELTRSAWLLALLVVAYSGSDLLKGMQMTTPDQLVITNPAGYAWLGMLIAGAGVLVRARWATFVLALATLSLAFAIVLAWPMTWRFAHGEFYRATILANAIVGLVAGAACAALAWRHARSAFGSLRDLLPRA